uniref:Uncharacterized protein n=1 Tax=Aegilops tauschii subsp. strangulata TaxID=200361 RepID=A0A453B0R2_AEGTS
NSGVASRVLISCATNLVCAIVFTMVSYDPGNSYHFMMNHRKDKTLPYNSGIT